MGKSIEKRKAKAFPKNQSYENSEVCKHEKNILKSASTKMCWPKGTRSMKHYSH